MPTGNPLTQRIDPATGNVTNEFVGRIQAEGVDIPVDNLAGGGDVPEEDKVSWIRADGGGLVASIEGSFFDNAPDTLASSYSLKHGVQESDIANPNNRWQFADLRLQSSRTTGGHRTSGIYAEAGSVSTSFQPNARTIIDSDRKSSFLSLGQAGVRQALTWTLWGPYVAAGATVAQYGVSDVNVAHNLGTTNLVALGSIANAFRFTWQAAIIDANTVRIRLHNAGNVNDNATLTFFLLTY